MCYFFIIYYEVYCIFIIICIMYIYIYMYHYIILHIFIKAELFICVCHVCRLSDRIVANDIRLDAVLFHSPKPFFSTKGCTYPDSKKHELFGCAKTRAGRCCCCLPATNIWVCLKMGYPSIHWSTMIIPMKIAILGIYGITR